MVLVTETNFTVLAISSSDVTINYNRFYCTPDNLQTHIRHDVNNSFHSLFSSLRGKPATVWTQAFELQAVIEGIYNDH